MYDPKMAAINVGPMLSAAHSKKGTISIPVDTPLSVSMVLVKDINSKPLK